MRLFWLIISLFAASLLTASADNQTPALQSPVYPGIPQISLSIPTGSVTVDGTTYARTTAGIQAAINACTTTCGNVHLTAGTYTISGAHITVHSNLNIYGDGVTTLLQGSVASDWVFYTISTTSIHDLSINNLKIDLQNGASASAISIGNAHNTVLSNLTFVNGAAGGWYINYQTPETNNNTQKIWNYNNYIYNVSMTGHGGTLENILIMNSMNFWMNNIQINTSSSPGIGVWQWDINTNLYNVSCVGGTVAGGAIYYNVPGWDLNIVNFYGSNCGNGIKGASASDNGPSSNNWGWTQFYNLNIINPTMVGGANTTGATAIEIGATLGSKLVNPTISLYGIAVAIDTGQSPISSMATNWAVYGGQIFNNNQTNCCYVTNAGIAVNAGAIITGGNLTTNGTTANTSAVLHFASVPAWVVAGMTVNDTTTPASIANNSIVQSTTGTTVTMNQNAAGTVGGTDVIAINTNLKGGIYGVNIFDSQGTHTQAWATSFNANAGTVTFDGVNIQNNSLNGYLGDGSIGFAAAALGPNSVVNCNPVYSGSPAQSAC